MANKTDFVVLCFGDLEQDALESFIERTGLALNPISNREKAGGDQLLTFNKQPERD